MRVLPFLLGALLLNACRSNPETNNPYVVEHCTSEDGRSICIHRPGEPLQKLLTFDRHAETLWSPDCRILAVNYSNASDESGCIVFRLMKDRWVHAFDSQKIAESCSSYHFTHLYIQVTGWRPDGSVEIHVSGYGDDKQSIDGMMTVAMRNAP